MPPRWTGAISTAPVGTGAVSRTMAPPTPPTIRDNDILVAFIIIETTQNPVTGLAPPLGWTLELDSYSNLVSGQEGHILCYTKRAASESGNYVWSWTSLLWNEGTIAVYSGCPTTGRYIDFVSAATPANGTTLTWSGTTVFDQTAIAFGLRQFNGGPFTGPGNEMFDGGANLETANYDVVGPAVAGATGTKTFTSGHTGLFQGVGAVLLPAPTLQQLQPISRGSWGS